MLAQPKTEHRKEQYYLAIATNVSMDDIPQMLPPLIPEVEEWMHHQQVKKSGPAFFLYHSINERNELECEAGFPTSLPVEENARLRLGSFPEGNYASILCTGDFKELKAAHRALQRWIQQQGLKEKVQTSAGVTRWGGRTEFYLVDPDLEPDPAKWQTQIMFLLED